MKAKVVKVVICDFVVFVKNKSTSISEQVKLLLKTVSVLIN